MGEAVYEHYRGSGPRVWDEVMSDEKSNVICSSKLLGQGNVVWDIGLEYPSQ